MRGVNNNSNSSNILSNINNNNNNNNNMEPSFYEDNAQFASQVNSLKRPHTLDLNSRPLTKKQRLNQTATTATSLVTPLILSSPDLQMLKFNTPELEKFIMSNNTLQTPTPSLVFPTKVTLEQEDYAKGFVDALNSLHNSETTQVSVTVNPTTTTSNTAAGPGSIAVLGSGGGVMVNNSNRNNPNTNSNSIITTIAAGAIATATTTNNILNISTNSMSGGSITYTNLDDSYPVAIKDEPQTVPNSPPLSPIDMETQERIKLERKRQRNRVAASKCRKRKLERISKLEDKVKILKGENADLASVVKQLKEHVFQLKQQVIDHMHAGCSVPPFSEELHGK